MPDSQNSSYQEILQRVACNVRQRRKQLGLTQEAAAQAMQMATRHLQKLEAGKLNVTLRTLSRVAIVLQLEIEDLLTFPSNAKETIT